MKPFFVTEEEFEAHALEIFDETTTEFRTRASGNATGLAVWGSGLELGLFTRYEDVRVMVIVTDMIFRNSSPTDVSPAVFPGECEKSRVVCAIKYPKHFDIGVVHTPSGIQAVFQEGDEWSEALGLILSFIKSRSPETSEEKPAPLCRQWTPSDEGECVCGETSCICIA